MSEVVIVSAVRTAIGKFQGSLQSYTSPRLGALVVKEAVRRAGVDPAQVDDCIMGCVLQAGVGQAPARQAAIFAGIPPEAGALTVNQVCGSGLRAISLAAQAVQTGDSGIVVAGGMESMSNAPYLLPQARNGYRMGNGTLVDAMINDGLWDVYNEFHMGAAAEMVAEKYHISRADQDAFAAESHRRAGAATTEGRFRAQILPVEVPPAKKGEAPRAFDADEAIRPDTTAEILAKLKPAFKKDGTVTAGNAPGVSDGAAAVVVSSAERATELGLKPMVIVRAQATAGRAPEWFSLAPIDAVRKVVAKAGWSLESVDLFELNEAFSVQALSVIRELGLDQARVNVNGGAVALGHPIGASGAAVLVKLIYAMADRGAKRGIASLCLGGGGAVALAVELPLG
ncbi:acetyl-CoA C-acetyltransferase [Telmatobacter sp. DSM 110680]|uniref:Acetyl-CoA C-acetyltransferase n=1 Tax=Telmatobacter sp. DSM 110680 TaxID=3036704 RepID=A0AAU7DQM0_9BACT